MKWRLKVCIARSALLDLFVKGGTNSAFRCFVVHDLELDEVSELGEPLVSAGIGVDDS